MVDVKKYCAYLYNSLYIPIYLYENEALLSAYPIQEKDTCPPSTYLASLWAVDRSVVYTVTEFYSYYGCIKIENSSYSIVIGPINDFPYSKDTLIAMSREFSVSNSRAEIFFEFFHNIPQQNLHTFINTLLLINYTLNNSELAKNAVVPTTGNSLNTTIKQIYSEDFYAEKEEEAFTKSYAFENEMLRFIETGNIKGLKRISTRGKSIKAGTVADNNLRQLKNIFIVVIALAARAAIRGGLAPSVSYQLSDKYIQQMERLIDIDAIKSLVNQVLLDYTSRVANSLIPVTADTVIRQVLQYVRANTNRDITVADAAHHVGFTRPSLSRKFKKELGVDLSTFIRKCKLEEAKNLLAFSDKSISEISNYLCFSSQSHFQKSFKDYFGITPQSYRKST
jgi:YSIRK-targeted surface antigen transcriptional regulator